MITIYTDSSCINNGSMEAWAGAGAWFKHDDLRNVAVRLPTDITQMYNNGEAVVIILATWAVPQHLSIKIRSDSKLVIDAFMSHLA